MPLLNPIKTIAVEEVLKEARKEQAKKSLKDILDSTLPVEEIIEAVADVCRDGASQSVKLRAAEVGARLHGLLRNDETPVVPVVNIIIRNKDSLQEVNPILIPRILQNESS